MKKITLLLFFVFTIISCSNDDGLDSNPVTLSNKNNSRLAATENVKLLKVFTSSDALYGFASYVRRFKVEVKNLAYNKNVVISHKMADGSWKDYTLNYISSTSNNTEIWGSDITITNSNYVGETPSLLFADEFVARYEVNGTKYWDNNGGQNYKVGNLEGTFLRSDLNVSVDTYYSAIYNSYSNSNIFSVQVDVRNISPTKLVSVVYTTDNWNTVKTAPLNFTPTLTVGARQWLTSPNRFGMERWIANIDIPKTIDAVKYAVVYKVNGVEYWDNNYEQNYTAVKN